MTNYYTYPEGGTVQEQSQHDFLEGDLGAYTKYIKSLTYKQLEKVVQDAQRRHYIAEHPEDLRHENDDIEADRLNEEAEK